MNQNCLSYIFGFKGTGDLAGLAKYEMRVAFPTMLKNYAILAGPVFGIS